MQNLPYSGLFSGTPSPTLRRIRRQLKGGGGALEERRPLRGGPAIEMVEANPFYPRARRDFFLPIPDKLDGCICLTAGRRGGAVEVDEHDAAALLAPEHVGLALVAVVHALAPPHRPR